MPALLLGAPATRLAVSDKILALGTAVGSVHLLDYGGNQARAAAGSGGGRATFACPPTHTPSPPLAHQVRALKEHSGTVTDLCFDESAEHLASCAADGSLVVSGEGEGEDE